MPKLHLADFEHLSSAFRALAGYAVPAVFHLASLSSSHLSLIFTFHTITLYHFLPPKLQIRAH